MIKINNITKTYQMGNEKITALKGVDLLVNKGDFVSIMGTSGSGKSTLMNIIGCLDKPSSGSYILDGEDVSALSDKQLAVIRNQKIGFVFQAFNLLPRMSALKNVELPLLYARVSELERKKRALQSLAGVELSSRADHKPNELSGGQQQRVAIARALVNHPQIIFADEPTGNLDSETGLSIIALFQKLHRQGATILMVTHEMDIALHSERIVYLKDGQIVGDEQVKHRSDASEALNSFHKSVIRK